MPSAPLVHPLVVIVAPKQITIREKPDRVVVLNSRQLSRWLVKRPPVLAAEDVAILATLLDDPGVWGQGSARRDDLSFEFARLDGEVRSARTRRKLWAGAGIVSIGAALLVGVPLIMQFYAGLMFSLMP